MLGGPSREAPHILAWKFPNEALATWSQLIVNELQEAFLLKGGQAEGPFGPGRHTLSTDNIPGLTALYKIPFGGRSPFTAEIWFINKIASLDLTWGTTDPLQILDPKLGVFLPVRSFGQMGVVVADGKDFLTSLVGVLTDFDHQRVAAYFRGSINSAIKTAIGAFVLKKQVNAFELSAHLPEIAEEAMQTIGPEFARFGLRVVNFFIHSINVPEDDPSVARVKEAMARRAEMALLGFNYQQERTFDTLQAAASNEGSPLASAGMGAAVGLGAAMPLGAALGGMVQRNLGDMASGFPGAASPDAAPKPASVAEKASILRELKALLDEGILTQDEFEAQKKTVLG